MEPIADIEKYYAANPDPWGYQTNPHDIHRKERIIAVCQSLGIMFQSILDIGCGEGWITKDLPAAYKFGIEVSETAISRWPECIQRYPAEEPLVDVAIATGILYSHYDYQLFLKKLTCAGQFVLTCNIKTWEVEPIRNPKWMKEIYKLEQIYVEEFPYREYMQMLRVFRKI